MPSRGLVRLKAICEMLDACAPGYTMKEHLHNYSVTWNGKTYPTLPRGAQGSGARAEIQLGHVKKMIRFLGIDAECARRHLPILQQ
jgi:hypothetical protein